MTSPNEVFVLRGLNETGKLVVDKLTKLADSGLHGKSLDSGDDFWFEGAEGKKVQGWTIKPPGFKSGDKKKWPILLAIHGGPEGAWEDQWSNRWNLNSELLSRYSAAIVLGSLNICTKSSLSKATSSLQLTRLVLPHSVKVGGRRYVSQLSHLHVYADFTDAIKEDWGGKPFVGKKTCVHPLGSRFSSPLACRSSEGLEICPGQLP